MKRITSLLALGFFSLGLATSASAQTKVTQLVIQNATGTTKLSQTSEGMTVDNYLILQRSGNANSTVKLTAPSSNGTREFLFPESSGTLLTNATNTFTSTQTFPTTAAQGDALIASINGGSTKIDAARLNITLPSSGLTSIGSAAAPLNNLTFFTDGSGNATGQLNLAASNTWTGTQSFALNAAQGDALIASINAGTPGGLTGYATSSALSALSATVATNTANIATNTGNIATLTTNLGNLTTSVNTNTSNIATLTTNLGNLSTTVTGNTNSINTLNTNYSTLSTAVTNLTNGSALPSTLLTETEVVGTAGQINANLASGTVTLSLPNAATNTGTFTNATVTIDAQGRVTAASNGSGGSGSFSATKASFTAGNSTNNDITPGSAQYIKITGPTNAFGIRSITGGTDGKMIILHNLSTQDMSMTNLQPGATAGTRIFSAGTTGTTGVGSVTLIYDSSLDSGSGPWAVVSVTP